MARGKKRTYDLYRVQDGKSELVAENVDRKILIEGYGIQKDKILYAAQAGRIVYGWIGKCRIRFHGATEGTKEERPKTICHVSAIKTSSGMRFGG